MASLMPQGKQRYTDNNGNNLAGGKLYTYEAGTSTPLATYSDQAGAVPNANPVVLNARGEATIFWGSAAYKAVLKDASDVEIWTQDNLQASIGAADLASTSATKGAALVGFDGGTLAAYLKNKSAQVVDSIAALKAIDKTKFTRAYVTGYYAAGDGGGGDYWFDSTDTTSTDNGGTIIVASDGGRWELAEARTPTVLHFGAKGDGTTDDTAAFQALIDWLAMDAAAATITSSRVALAPGGRTYRLNTITVRSGVTLAGEIVSIPDEYSANEPVLPATLLMNSAQQIVLQISSGLHGLTITKYGMTFPQGTAQVATWTGTAVSCPNNGASISACVILGFALAVDAPGHSRLRMRDVLIDCLAGVKNTGSFDVTYLTRVHCWPYASIGHADGAAAQKRSGAAFYLENVADWAKLTDCFAFGYFYSYRFNNVNSVTALSCGADSVSGGYAGSVGFLVQGTSGDIRLVSPQVAAHDYGIYLENAAANGDANTQISNPNIWDCLSHDVIVKSACGVQIDGGRLSGPAAGVTIDHASSYGTIRGVWFKNDVSQPINQVTASNNFRISECVLESGGAVNLELAGFESPLLTAAATLTLNQYHDTQRVDGATTISALSVKESQVGRRVVLYFSAGLTITHSATLFLKGAANATVPAGGVMSFAFFGNGTWREVSRNF